MQLLHYLGALLDCLGTLVCETNSFATYCWQIQYDDGDQEIGAAFQRYSLEQGRAGQQMVQVHEFKPGNYKPQADHVEGSKAATTTTAKQSAEAASFSGEA